MASIQFIRGVDEEVSDVRLTRSKDGRTGQAIFYFDSPRALSEELKQEILGMFLVDEEGELVSRQVNAKFVNGQPKGIEAVYVMKSSSQWDRFMRFMERYAKANGLDFQKS
ncbi:photosystem II reaction center protein Psb28 [Prochlorothrix hollandica]|uniref:Photosystem II reaction center Psb28 protein n=1 Tax=Prochlorothrix hollandica PCC 9006 = CALU 1027 TaxID=317619 RepID=A0A0M2PSH6_PROHO|nr:photosystem II reaction center protein Psb28 [Prochlorothrix hollandica]KKI98117.1 photosystem II reaction center protein Psb28 [Prochlorothrix hollandica PCC 9006 = CALU 1027]